MDVKKLKVDNIKDMLKRLGQLHKNMSGSELKKDYSRFLYFIQSNKADLKKILDYTNKRIDLYSADANSIKGMQSKYVVMFWRRVKDIVIGAYLKNKQLDRSA